MSSNSMSSSSMSSSSMAACPAAACPAAACPAAACPAAACPAAASSSSRSSSSRSSKPKQQQPNQQQPNQQQSYSHSKAISVVETVEWAASSRGLLRTHGILQRGTLKEPLENNSVLLSRVVKLHLPVDYYGGICEASIGTEQVCGVCGDNPRPLLVATRDIEAGEEILWGYNDVPGEDDGSTERAYEKSLPIELTDELLLTLEECSKKIAQSRHAKRCGKSKCHAGHDAALLSLPGHVLELTGPPFLAGLHNYAYLGSKRKRESG